MTSKKQRIGAKSLRPYVSFKSVASLLLVVVCTSLWAIVWFTGPETTRADEVGIQWIEWFDNNKEYLSELKLRQDETSQAISFYANKSLSGVLMVSGTVSIGSTNTGNVTSFVGGGSENVANGENTLILWGKGNSITAVNGVVLWGITNNIIGDATNAFLGGGSGNRIGTGKASVLLGGKNNSNNGGIIMGMENNTIAGGTNNLILGAKVTIPDTISNTLVWSTVGNFSPTTGNAFYANTSGVGINTNAPQVVFDSKGAVKFWSVSTWCTAENVGVTRYIGGSLCGCTAKGYWESLTESLIETGTNACNDDNNSCNYIFSGALNRYVFEGEGCSTEIVAKCHFAENGFTYCFPIYFWEREVCAEGESGVFPYCFDVGF